MKILIVDDNANNRMVLNLLLQDYGEDKNEIYEIDECENGLEAVNKAKRGNYNIIFMDIMMPEMDGIEATKKIRANNKDVMIIAVSAVDDELKQKEILRNGAEDYVPKPIDSKVLNARLDNYFALLRLRVADRLSSHTKGANLFTKEIFKRQTIFYASDEEALAEFWEYYLLRDVGHKIDGLSDVVRAIFSLGEAIISLKGEPWIIVEGDNDAIYFTINRVEVVGEMVIKMIMKKNKEVKDFKFDSEKISFKLNNILTPIEQTQERKSEPSIVVEESSEEVENIRHEDVAITQTNVEEYEVYHYMDAEDLCETEELLGDLSSLMLMLGNSDIQPTEVAQISQHLERLGRNLSTYSESYTIGQSLISLSQGVSSEAERFQEIAADLSALSSAFVSDLQSWMKMTFHDGAPSINFMDDTIVANTQTICAMLNTDEGSAANGDMDDIFDF